MTSRSSQAPARGAIGRRPVGPWAGPGRRGGPAVRLHAAAGGTAVPARMVALGRLPQSFAGTTVAHSPAPLLVRSHPCNQSSGHLTFIASLQDAPFVCVGAPGPLAWATVSTPRWGVGVFGTLGLLRGSYGRARVGSSSALPYRAPVGRCEFLGVSRSSARIVGR